MMESACAECDRLIIEHTAAMVEYQERLDACRADLAVITDEDELLPMREHLDHFALARGEDARGVPGA